MRPNETRDGILLFLLFCLVVMAYADNARAHDVEAPEEHGEVDCPPNQTHRHYSGLDQDGVEPSPDSAPYPLNAEYCVSDVLYQGEPHTCYYNPPSPAIPNGGTVELIARPSDPYYDVYAEFTLNQYFPPDIEYYHFSCTNEVEGGSGNTGGGDTGGSTGGGTGGSTGGTPTAEDIGIAVGENTPSASEIGEAVGNNVPSAQDIGNAVGNSISGQFPTASEIAAANELRLGSPQDNANAIKDVLINEQGSSLIQSESLNNDNGLVDAIFDVEVDSQEVLSDLENLNNGSAGDDGLGFSLPEFDWFKNVFPEYSVCQSITFTTFGQSTQFPGPNGCIYIDKFKMLIAWILYIHILYLGFSIYSRLGK